MEKEKVVTKKFLGMVTAKIIEDIELETLNKLSVHELMYITEEILMNEFFNDIEFDKLIKNTKFSHNGEQITYDVELLSDRHFLTDFLIKIDIEQYTLEEMLKRGFRGYDNMTIDELASEYIRCHG